MLQNDKNSTFLFGFSLYTLYIVISVELEKQLSEANEDLDEIRVRFN